MRSRFRNRHTLHARRHGGEKGRRGMFRGIFVRLATAAALTGLASFGLLGAAPSGFAAGGAGSLDPRFGRSGEVVTGLGTNQVATDAVLQPNGDIVLSVGIGAVRYLPNGSLDSTFAAARSSLSPPASSGRWAWTRQGRSSSCPPTASSAPAVNSTRASHPRRSRSARTAVSVLATAVCSCRRASP